MLTPEQFKTLAALMDDEKARLTLLKAQGSDPSVLPALCSLLDEHPEVWRAFGDLGRSAEESLLDLVSGKSVLLKESVRRKLSELRQEIGGPEPSPLGKLLGGRAALCWLQAHDADARAAGAIEANAPPHAQADVRRRQDAAQQRLVAAVKALAWLRKLLRPPLSPFELASKPVAESSRPDSASRTGTASDRLKRRAAAVTAN